ncbi:TAT-variant-translocated molybdopterin oxidoreductase [Algisphaera agarilytica]|uniref:Molybdopterin-containing oxidoreductase family iron-sulfur binding subunit n=1 Tax=Algisphaera agarilytica TaxID=1385975 RepID=A0A7X0H7W0_9BACT|nr:TAT-variant-translocated molybdopterin oxidoreductase [Algisphaera agarilytica]MBB6429445.1 molybdopterin-containing oxidoreductase family iron-sulfur binding subunit [Algisphaera agarilytica]
MIEPNLTASEDLQGQRYWRSLDEYSNSPELLEKIAQEFPEYDPDELLGMSRRKFMKLAGASMALAGLTLTGCRRWPKEKVVAHNARPEGTLPGVPETYASMLQRGGVANGLFVTSFDGRPINVAGSPLHPIVGDAERYAAGDLQYGSADVFTLASLLDMYDPDRSRSVKKYSEGEGKGKRSSWEEFAGAVSGLKADSKIAVLSEAQSGPAFADVKKRFLKHFPQATWTTWEPLHRDSEIEGSGLAFGQALRAQYDASKAMVLATFDSDFLSDHPASAKHARGWAKLRKSCDEGKMSRVYAVAPALSVTSSNADVHLQVKPSTIAAMLEALAVEIGVSGLNSTISLGEAESLFVKKLAKDLKEHKGESLVVVGPSQPAAVHALAWSINETLGNLHKTVMLTQEPAGDKLCVDEIAELTDKLNAGEVDTLLILGGNPVFDAPADLGFAEALAKAETSIHLGLYENETSVSCGWHLPEAHYLECWGDGRAWDGTICLQQPIIEPLFGGKSPIEVLAMIGHDDATEGYDLVRRAWSAAIKAGQYDVATSAWPGGPVDNSAENAWRVAVHDGLLAGTAFPLVNAKTVGASGTSVVATTEAMQIAFRQDPKVYDGRYANNGWLQELPETITKITWDNPAWVSVQDALDHDLKNGDVINIKIDDRELDCAVMITPGQAPGVVVLTVGQGRSWGGRIATGVGFNTYTLRGTTTQGCAYSAQIKKTGQTHPLATTEIHHLIDTGKLGPDALSGGKDRDGSGAMAAWALDKRVGKKPGDEGYIVKQTSFADYKKYLQKLDKDPKALSFANDDAHGDLSLQLYDAPLAEEFAERAKELMEKYPEEVADGWTPKQQFNDKHAWGMTIDMTACTGCNACVIACQSENNVPIVGKDQVMMSREMQWIRIDSYYRGKPQATKNFKVSKDDKEVVDAVHMPVTCVHCENAPCEQVCPVAATVHDTEGLNTMVYNRCIGTRYCSNNCPYKVRRFNYFDYHSKLDSASFRNTGKDGGLSNSPWLKMPDQQPGDVIDQIRRMVFNPDVTVRMRGVMEKCTYCTQRIQRAKIEAKARWAEAKTAGQEVDDYPYVDDGKLTTACQGACPTEAITFGNLNDPKAKVAQIQSKNKRAYKLLSELNSRPRTQHMGLVRNPVKA